MKVLSTLAILLVFSVALIAQSPTPSPTPVPGPNDGIHLDLSAAFTSVSSSPNILGSGNQSATVLTLRAPITDRFAGRVETITLPGQATITLAELEYRRNLSDFLKAKHLRFDASKFQLWTYGGFGGKQSDGSSRPAFSAIAGGGVDRVLTGNIALRLFDLAYLRASLDKKGLFLSNNHFTASAGVVLRF